MVLGRCTVDGVCWDTGPLEFASDVNEDRTFYINTDVTCDDSYCWSGFLIEVSTGGWASAGDQNCSYFDGDPTMCEVYTWLDEISPGFRCCACGGGSETAPPPPLPPIAPYPPSSCATFRLIKPEGHTGAYRRSCLAVP